MASVLLASGALAASAHAANWQPVQNLSAAGAEAQEAQVAFDSRGNALAIWHRGGFAETRFRPRGGSFGPVQNLSLPGGNALRGQVAFDAAGNALTVWGRSLGALPDFAQARDRFAGGGLGALQTVTTGNSVDDPGVAVDPAGNALVTWARRLNPGDDRLVETRFRPAGGSFEAIQTHSSPGVSAGREQVAFDPAGNALVIWQRPIFGDNRVQARFRPAGGDFGATKDLSAAGAHSAGPQIAFDATGDALATWTRGSRVQARFRPAGGGFGATQNISSAAENAGPPQIAVDPGGSALIVWATFGGTEQVQARTRSPSGNLGPIQILSEDGGTPEQPQVAVDPEGNAVAVWVRWFGSEPRIEAAFRPAGGSFEPAQTLSAPGGDAYAPQVAIDAAGNALAVWHRYDGDFDRVQARFLPGPGGGLPSNEFSFGKVKRNKKRGTAKLTVIVPGPGELELAKNKKVKPKGKRAGSAGKVKLPIKPRRKAKKRLKRRGKARVKAKVTYVPTGGEPNTKSKKLKLKKRKKKRL